MYSPQQSYAVIAVNDWLQQGIHLFANHAHALQAVHANDLQQCHHD